VLLKGAQDDRFNALGNKRDDQVHDSFLIESCRNIAISAAPPTTCVIMVVVLAVIVVVVLAVIVVVVLAVIVVVLLAVIVVVVMPLVVRVVLMALVMVVGDVVHSVALSPRIATACPLRLSIGAAASSFVAAHGNLLWMAELIMPARFGFAQPVPADSQRR